MGQSTGSEGGWATRWARGAAHAHFNGSSHFSVSAETRHAFNYVTFRVLTALMHVQRNFVALDEGFSTHQVTGSAAQNPGRRYSFKISLSKFPINMIETNID
jgi:hypothetical protein